jgi:hypothetical protein
MLDYLQRQSNIQSKLPKKLDPFSPTVYNFYNFIIIQYDLKQLLQKVERL